MQADKPNNCQYNKQLRPLANKLRKEMTKAEACLWKYVLRARLMKDYSFRRQRPVLGYIADFMCKELKLIIEVDGATHEYEEVSVKDKVRQDKLELEGFTVLRFTDDEVLKDMEGVKSVIENWIEKLQRETPPPAPASGGESGPRA